MIKRLLIIFVLFFSLFSFTVAEDTPWDKSNDITSSDFIIKVNDISPAWENLLSEDRSAKKTAQNLLNTIVNKFIVAFWVLAMLVMTIGWGYMIMYHGQDELLSKWKSIFNAWLIALAVALSSWLLVKLVAYFLY